jgi:hypothetical protein
MLLIVYELALVELAYSLRFLGAFNSAASRYRIWRIALSSFLSSALFIHWHSVRSGGGILPSVYSLSAACALRYYVLQLYTI